MQASLNLEIHYRSPFAIDTDDSMDEDEMNDENIEEIDRLYSNSKMKRGPRGRVHGSRSQDDFHGFDDQDGISMGEISSRRDSALDADENQVRRLLGVYSINFSLQSFNNSQWNSINV